VIVTTFEKDVAIDSSNVVAFTEIFARLLGTLLGTAFDNSVPNIQNEGVPANGTVVPFNQRQI
jgi:hypothetical protein